ncbi:lysophospholipid acyltransferase family protein [Chelativorans intermedius]|uniref:Lysophospholipid acyltransferase family protein n=1 Tax=Chelativorans intermedius TaxID=515947 RepID=A0ABV6D6S4_9HYPH|nr:lysophospholipid acyltransferase family protein [Chelativorans intermedius]MCT8998210.1 1-acyl-sn-glycerol-3-phosphate acyltransferase [Chelativorans intermedius]
MRPRTVLSTLRLLAALLPVALWTPPMMLAQALAIRTGWWSDRVIPRLWHRLALRVLGIRVRVHGRMATQRPLLIAANHVSWTDIMVLGSLDGMHFIAKAEVRDWPVAGSFARLQRSVFVERERRRASPLQAREIAGRLADGDPMVLFAEGTTGEGSRVQPFKSTLFGAAQQALVGSGGERVLVQPVAIAYMRRNGLPLDRRERSQIAWIGQTALLPHLRMLLDAGRMEVDVHFGEPIPFCANSDRKAVARAAEGEVRRMLVAALRGRETQKARDSEKPSVF